MTPILILLAQKINIFVSELIYIFVILKMVTDVEISL